MVKLITTASSRCIGQLSILVPTTAFSTTADLVQVLPVAFAIIDCDLLSSIDASRNETNSLEAKPRKAFVLRVGKAGMIDEAREVAFAALEDLICWAAIDR